MKPIIIASMGRAGSTLMMDTISKKIKYNGFVLFENKKIKQNLDFKDHKNIVEGVYKTHDLSNNIDENFKCIYLFSNPMNSVISAHKYTNLEVHYKNLSGDWSLRNEWHLYDSLKLEQNFDSYYKKQNFDLITVRYETLYNNIDIIENFLGLKLTFPSKIERRTNWKNHKFSEELLKTYGNLWRKIKNADDIKVW